MIGTFKRLLALAVAAGALTAPVHADVAVLTPSADNTVYSEANFLSNGAGDYVFAGKNGGGLPRRALLKFDLWRIPPGSTINSVSLRMYMSRARGGNATVNLHRLTADWGEANSDADSNEGGGGGAMPGDATWGHQFFDNDFWATPGGDYAVPASGSATVGFTVGFYTWNTTPGLVADVQSWLNNPSANHGWIVIGNEAATQTAKRFNSREHPTAAQRPQLTINYTPNAPTGACCIPNGTCLVTTAAHCTLLGGLYQGNGAACSPNPCPQPTGACCVGSVCSIMTQLDCAAQGGTFGGPGSTCIDFQCPDSQFLSTAPAADNTLYQTNDGSTSNGAGETIGAGTTVAGSIRRGVVRFDLSFIPTTAIVNGARLRMHALSTPDPTLRNVSLHRLLQDFGEGTSNADGDESLGAPATSNDATWLHAFFPDSYWSSPGGDFAVTPSATRAVGSAAADVAWMTTGLLADVQGWVQNPASNYGWAIKGDESVAGMLRRFESGEALPAARPVLELSYVVPPSGACCLPNATCIETSAAVCAAQGGTYNGDDTLCVDYACPLVLTPFVDALPIPAVAQPTSGQVGGAATYTIAMTEFMQQLHRDLPPTRLWGYGGAFPGPTIEARTNQPVQVTWINDLRNLENGQLRTTHALPVDTCLHGPDQTGGLPVTVVHLHGGHVPAGSDGYPEDAFPPGQQSAVYDYPNKQRAATLWYHDHALGLTRLNVMMGLAGCYIVRDDAEEALNIPRGEFEVPLLVQDRTFNPDGSLVYHDEWMEHFFGDTILVNGKVWPYLDVKQGKYRFRVVNGSNSRVYTLSLSDGASFSQIGSDLGLLAAPVSMTSLTIAPGERADVVIDFGAYAPGTQVTLLNSAPAPFPGTPGVGVVPNVMQFVVQAQPGDADPLPSSLVPVPRTPESESVVTREFLLRRMTSTCPHGPMWAINDMMWDDITERPLLGTTEIWSWINPSDVVHPMHMHLVSFQVLDRQDFTLVNNQVIPTGPRVAPPPAEMGWKDTVQAYPGQITRVIARFENYGGLFAYHCHVLEHEDHEMMRQFEARCPTLSITQSPASKLACVGEQGGFNVGASGAGLTYQWRRNGQPLADGQTPSGSVIDGASAPTLVIDNITQQDAGTYDCRVTDGCGEVRYCSGAALTVYPCDNVCDSIDFNGDGLYPDNLDIEDFLTVFGGGPCSNDPNCGDIDFNNDGLFPDNTDLQAFFSVFGGGGCF